MGREKRLIMPALRRDFPPGIRVPPETQFAIRVSSKEHRLWHWVSPQTQSTRRIRENERSMPARVPIPASADWGCRRMGR
jgi:hypothetical protein